MVAKQQHFLYTSDHESETYLLCYIICTNFSQFLLLYSTLYNINIISLCYGRANCSELKFILHLLYCNLILPVTCIIFYNISSRIVAGTQTRAQSESSFITDTKQTQICK